MKVNREALGGRRVVLFEISTLWGLQRDERSSTTLQQTYFEPIWYPIAGHLCLHPRHLSTPVCWKLIYRIKLLLDGRSEPKCRLPNGHSILLTSSKIIPNGWLTIRNVSKGCFLLSITISIGRVSLGSMVANNLSLNEYLPLNVVMWKISPYWRKHFFYEKNF